MCLAWLDNIHFGFRSTTSSRLLSVVVDSLTFFLRPSVFHLARQIDGVKCISKFERAHVRTGVRYLNPLHVAHVCTTHSYVMDSCLMKSIYLILGLALVWCWMSVSLGVCVVLCEQICMMFRPYFVVLTCVHIRNTNMIAIDLAIVRHCLASLRKTTSSVCILCVVDTFCESKQLAGTAKIPKFYRDAVFLHLSCVFTPNQNQNPICCCDANTHKPRYV